MSRSTRSEAAWVKWRGLVGQQEASGLSVHRFCEQRGMPASSMFAWRRKLRKADAVAGTGEAAATRPTFVEVMRDGAGPGPKVRDRVGGLSRGGVTVELACGRRIVLERGFDRELLHEVIEVLEHITGESTGGERLDRGAS